MRIEAENEAFHGCPQEGSRFRPTRSRRRDSDYCSSGVEVIFCQNKFVDMLLEPAASKGHVERGRMADERNAEVVRACFPCLTVGRREVEPPRRSRGGKRLRRVFNFCLWFQMFD